MCHDQVYIEMTYKSGDLEELQKRKVATMQAEAQGRHHPKTVCPASIPSPLQPLRAPLFDVFLSKQVDLNWASRPFVMKIKRA